MPNIKKTRCVYVCNILQFEAIQYATDRSFVDSRVKDAYQNTEREEY